MQVQKCSCNLGFKNYNLNGGYFESKGKRHYKKMVAKLGAIHLEHELFKSKHLPMTSFTKKEDTPGNPRPYGTRPFVGKFGCNGYEYENDD
ncbi:MAG: hypothetical protein KAS04_00490, partial [Candidatus Aenigmarchaeota archaeon]|nr:hypothetical protein [Candidatus Aenigmarchaeota archaeon]